MMTDLFAHAEARRLRDDDMARALENAERAAPRWADEAYSFLISFARRRRTFISEQVSAASKVEGMRQPVNGDRAWGQVYRKAAKAGIIVQDGYGRSARRHESICLRWTSRIYSDA